MAMKGQIKLRKEIADRLKQARIAAGYQTASEFSQKYALNPKVYVAHEEGKNALKASHAHAYARHLNVSLFWLMLGSD